jgi:hypothetical protein
MQQIAQWLEKLGMSEYAQRFAENGIGFPALSHLAQIARPRVARGSRLERSAASITF